MANRRAQIAADEVFALREEVNSMREELAKAREDLATEKLKCTAAVNKIQQVGVVVAWKEIYYEENSLTGVPSEAQLLLCKQYHYGRR